MHTWVRYEISAGSVLLNLMNVRYVLNGNLIH